MKRKSKMKPLADSSMAKCWRLKRSPKRSVSCQVAARSSQPTKDTIDIAVEDTTTKTIIDEVYVKTYGRRLQECPWLCWLRMH